MKKTLENFKNQMLTKEQMRCISGGSKYINQAIFHLLTEREEINQNLHHADYRYLAYQMAIPLSTLRRFVLEGSNLNARNQTKLLNHLGYASWEDLEKDAILLLNKRNEAN